MPTSLPELAVLLSHPPMLSLCLALLALLLLARHRRIGVALLFAAAGWSALWSIPAASDALRGSLERRHPVLEAAQLPHADAIVVLGGGSYYPWLDRPHLRAADLKHSRLAAGARAWLAGRAPRIVLSGGGSRQRSEAQTMAHAITRLDVPAAALLLEEESGNTRENARNVAALAQRHGIARVLLVTSAVHMPRALAEFRAAGLDAVAVPVPERMPARGWRERWLPSPRALWRSGRALKEYGGLLLLYLRQGSGLYAPPHAGERVHTRREQ